MSSWSAVNSIFVSSALGISDVLVMAGLVPAIQSRIRQLDAQD